MIQHDTRTFPWKFWCFYIIWPGQPEKHLGTQRRSLAMTFCLGAKFGRTASMGGKPHWLLIRMPRMTIWGGYTIVRNYQKIIEGSLEVKLPTIWTGGKAEMRRVREEKPRSEKIRERVRRKKTQVREKVGTSRFTVFFQNTSASEHF